MKFLKQFSIFLSVALLTLTAFSCSESGLTDPDTNNEEVNSNVPATFTVKLTDAPGDFESVFVDIQKVKIHRADSAETDTTQSDSTEADSTDDDDRWITVSEEPMRVDLLTLQNGNIITLGETQLEPGTYDQMRLVLGDDNEVVVGGESHFLKTPSAQQSGLKLQIDAEVEGGSSYTLLVDFDASRSIVKTGNGNNPNFNYLLKPVLRAVNLQETGSISGIVEPTDFSTSVFTVVNEDTIATTTEEDGSFQIMGLAAGLYDLNFEPDSSGFQDTTITDIEVLEGEDTDIGTVTLSENEN
jgi:hypothetical protein